jgi:hypothetical protein
MKEATWQRNELIYPTTRTYVVVEPGFKSWLSGSRTCALDHFILLLL